MALRFHLTTALLRRFAWFFLLPAFVGSVSLGQNQSVAGVSDTHDTVVRVQPPPSAPTGATRCMFCHPSEVEGYARPTMAHSLRLAGQEQDGSVDAKGSKITMHSAPTGFWQHWENAGDKNDYRVNFVIGSGNHAKGYLVELGGRLF
jgi:hypothetical protein